MIDIDRKPFGFGESRKQAPLSNIQNVTAERPGFFATIFDYGNVHIETAGAEAEIVFDKIPRPSRVLRIYSAAWMNSESAAPQRWGNPARGIRSAA